MTGEEFVDVTYRGIEVGTRLRLCEFGPHTAYLELPKPMPVGTRLEITTERGLELAGLVLRVHEQVAGADSSPGMRIDVGKLGGNAKKWWNRRVSVADPVIPEPPEATTQEAAPPEEAAAPAEEEAAPPEEATAPAEEEATAPAEDEAAREVEEALAEVAAVGEEATAEGIPEASVIDSPTMPGKTGAKKTMIMSTDEIKAAIEAGGQEAILSNGVPSPVESDADEPSKAAADDSGDDDKPKKRKKRKRKKRKAKS